MNELPKCITEMEPEKLSNISLEKKTQFHRALPSI